MALAPWPGVCASYQGAVISLTSCKQPRPRAAPSCTRRRVHDVAVHPAHRNSHQDSPLPQTCETLPLAAPRQHGRASAARSLAAAHLLCVVIVKAAQHGSHCGRDAVHHPAPGPGALQQQQPAATQRGAGMEASRTFPSHPSARPRADPELSGSTQASSLQRHPARAARPLTQSRLRANVDTTSSSSVSTEPSKE